MQRLFLISLLIIALFLFAPLLVLPKTEEKVEETPTETAVPQPILDAKYTFSAMDDSGRVFETTMGEYLSGAVAAEMPALFADEALKAQAVAIRTYIMSLKDKGNPKHPQADVCSDSACCKAFIDEEAMKQKWGEDFEQNLFKIQSAVAETDGQYLVYEGEIIQAVFHSSSEGSTEASSAIWSDVPYLVSVESPETVEDVPTLVTKEEFSPDELFNIFLDAYPDAELQDDFTLWLSEISRTDSGRVSSLNVGNKNLSGDEVRKLFSLRSTDFDVEFDGEMFIFTVRGYGHGVGMSQYGANVLAEEGYTYDEILAHYFQGTYLVHNYVN